MRSTIPTAALVALYLSLAQAAAASPDGGSISALLERIASQHHKALPANAVPSDLKAVTTIVDAAAAPTSLPSGSVVLAPKDKADKAAHKRMAKAVRKRAFEGEEILARAAQHDEELNRAEKRWIRATYIIQDGDTNPAIPTDGGNYVMSAASAIAANTPADSIVVPSFPAVQSSAAPTPASQSPASVNTPHATIAMPSFPPRSSATPSASVVQPAVSSVANKAVPNVLALASSVQAAASSASSAVTTPVKAKATPISGFFHNVLHGIEHDFQRFEVAIGAKKAASSVVPAATTAAAVNGKEKRWVWANSIINDGDTNPALPSDGSNVNLLSDGIDVATPVNSIVTPTFPPLASSAAPTATAAAVDDNAEFAQAAELALASATDTAQVAVAAATEASTLGAVKETVEDKLAAIAKGFAEVEAATASKVAGAFNRQRREFEIAHSNSKRVEKLIRRNLK